jgi:hypothetical protein
MMDVAAGHAGYNVVIVAMMTNINTRHAWPAPVQLIESWQEEPGDFYHYHVCGLLRNKPVPAQLAVAMGEGVVGEGGDLGMDGLAGTQLIG